jgi:hypothetical protein
MGWWRITAGSILTRNDRRSSTSGSDFGELIEQYLTDSRGKNAQFCFAEPPDAAPVWKHTAADGGFAAASRIGTAARRSETKTPTRSGVLLGCTASDAG